MEVLFVLLLLILLFVILFRLKNLYRGLYDAVAIFIYKGAPFVVSKTDKIKTMINLAGLKKTDRVIDLGSGDGRIVFEAAKSAKSVAGYDINPFVITESERLLKEKYAKYSDKVIFKRTDFMKEDLSGFDVVFVYGIGYLMKNLQKKLNKELKEGSRVVSNYFIIPDWKYTRKENDVYLYVK